MNSEELIVYQARVEQVHRDAYEVFQAAPSGKVTTELLCASDSLHRAVLALDTLIGAKLRAEREA